MKWPPVGLGRLAKPQFRPMRVDDQDDDQVDDDLRRATRVEVEESENDVDDGEDRDEYLCRLASGKGQLRQPEVDQAHYYGEEAVEQEPEHGLALEERPELDSQPIHQHPHTENDVDDAENGRQDAHDRDACGALDCGVRHVPSSGEVAQSP